MTPRPGPECKKLAKVPIVRELWTLFVARSSRNLGAFEGDVPFTQRKLAKSRNEDIQALEWMQKRRQVVVSLRIIAQC